MQDHNLSRKAIDVLAENGYRFKSENNVITIRRSSGIMGIIVLFIITIFLSIPVFSAGIVYGVGLIVIVVGFVLIKRLYFSRKSQLTIDRNNNTFTAIVDTYYQEDQPLTMISSLTLQSKFIDEYTTAAKNSVEEYLVSIAIQLITKEEVILFQLKSEQSDPPEEINEIYRLLENAIKGAKAT